MSRTFISLIAGAAIAVTAGTAPARADTDDAAAALAAILGLAIVGKVIHDRNKDRHSAPAPTHHVAPKHITRNHVPHHVQPRPLPERAKRHKVLPQACFRTFQTRHGQQVRGFGSRCLSRNYQYAHRLPDHCATRVQTRKGWGWAYRARCLRDGGYTLARH